MNQRRLTTILALLLALLLSACATTENHHDPIEPVNRATDTINDSIDRVTLKPMAQGYTAVVPKPMRTAVSNFYENATYLNTVLNGFLQGKGGQGVQDLIRFLINTTLGVGGLVDVASSMGLERHQEDFGQTLATWGVGQGAYIVYPLLGPNSVRNTSDFITETATDPLFWAAFALAPYITIPVTALKYIDKRAQLLDASSMRDEPALDPYIFTREAWRQNREYKIYDGNPPQKESDDDDWEEDEWADNEADESPAPKTKIHMQDMAAGSTPPDGPNVAVNSAPEAIDDSGPSIKQEQVKPQTDNEFQAEAIANQTETVSAAEPLYLINLSSHYSEVEAAAAQGKLNRYGIETEIRPVHIQDKTWYRVSSKQHIEIEQAKKKLAELKTASGLAGAWLEPVQ